MGSQDLGSEVELLDPNTRAIKRNEPRPRARQFVATRGLGSVAVDVIPDRRESTAQIEVRRFGDLDATPLARFTLRVGDRLGAVEFLEVDNDGRMFMFVENIPKNSSRAIALVTRHSATGVLEGMYELPLGNVPLSRRFVAVTGSGDVHFLRTQRGQVDVLGIGFRPLPSTRPIDVRPSAPPAPAPTTTTTAKGPLPKGPPPGRPAQPPAGRGDGICVRKHPVAGHAGRLWPRPRHRLHRLQRPDPAAGLFAQQAEPGGARHPLLLGLHGLTGTDPRAHRARYHGGQYLNPQRPSHRRRRGRLFGAS
jgi:hypothetical protein